MINYEKAYQILSDRQEIFATLLNFPNECPYCHNIIYPQFLSHHFDKESYEVNATLLCPNSGCNKPFIAEYQAYDNTVFKFHKILFPSLKKYSFNDEIKLLSEKFIEIYNQAYEAEQYRLFEICGIGYRKALEFLIKDYLVNVHPEDIDNISKISISNCINQYVKDERLKSTAERAIWLGNDETHYIKKWDTKDLNDLKVLIRLTVNWIETDVLTNKYLSSMQK